MEDVINHNVGSWCDVLFLEDLLKDLVWKKIFYGLNMEEKGLLMGNLAYRKHYNNQFSKN